MIGGRKVRSNKGKRRGPYKTGRTRSGAKFRGRNSTVKRRTSNNKPRKVRSNKGKKRTPYGPRSRTRSGKKFRGGMYENSHEDPKDPVNQLENLIFLIKNQPKKKKVIRANQNIINYLSKSHNWMSVSEDNLRDSWYLLNEVRKFEGSGQIATAISTAIKSKGFQRPSFSDNAIANYKSRKQNEKDGYITIM